MNIRDENLELVRTTIKFAFSKYRQMSIPTLQEILINLHTEPHRKYHNVNHLAYMINKAIELGYHDLDHEIYQAILFHDCAYYPQSKYNEELSTAFYSDNVLSPILAVKRAIEASKHHTIPENDLLMTWQKHFLDLDLLAMSDSSLYKANAYRIWREFEPFVEPHIFISGRAKWLESMLSSNNIYWELHEAEAPTRKNMFDELTALNQNLYDISISVHGRHAFYIYGDLNEYYMETWFKEVSAED